jgi:hypothetical protein
MKLNTVLDRVPPGLSRLALSVTLLLAHTLVFPLWSTSSMSTESALIIDDRGGADLCANTGTCWQAITDSVMGGVSEGRLVSAVVDGRPCLRLTGQVSLENNGGFVQASLDLSPDGLLDARGYAGIELDVLGNSESYNLHLRSADTRIVWQSYRATFQAPPHWQTLRLPFSSFQPYRTDIPLDLSKLRRLGLVAIGREMKADLCVARLSFYR